MSRRIILTLTLTTLVFAGAQVIKHSHASSTQPLLGPTIDAASAQSPGTKVVEVTFDGLMLFQGNGDYYDVGIMPAADHDFVIFKNGLKVYPARGSADRSMRWTLDVMNARGDVMRANISTLGPRDCNRLPTLL